MDWANGEQDRVYFGIRNHFVPSFCERLSYKAAVVNCGWALMRPGADAAGKHGQSADRLNTTMIKSEE
jgi:hypothetical protein